MKPSKIVTMTKKRSSLRYLFGIVSLIFLLFFAASQLYQMKTFKNTLSVQYRQTMSVLAELVVYQTYDKMKSILDDSSVITQRLEQIHLNVLHVLKEHPDKTLTHVKQELNNNSAIELYRFDENMRVVETTYSPDENLDLSYLRDYFQERRDEKTIDVTQYPVYEPFDGDYMFYSMVYRPHTHDFLQLSWREAYDPKLVNFHHYLRQIPEVKNIEVFVYDPKINRMKGLYRYFKDKVVKTKKEYMRHYLRHETEVTEFYFANPSASVRNQMEYNAETKELIYDKLLKKEGVYPRVVVRVVLDAQNYEQQVMNVYWTHGFWFVGTVGFILFLLYILRKRIIIPVTQIAYNVYQKNLLPSHLCYYDDEIGEIARAYNQALSDLSKEIDYSETLLQNQERFIRTSIHEINTPLTIISLYSELLQMETGENPNIRQIEAGVRILKNTFEDLSYLIKRETQPITPKNIDLELFVQERIEFFSVIAEVNTKTILCESSGSKTVRIDATQLQRLIDNTLSNAIKYSSLNTIIHVKIYESDDGIVFSVSNVGEIINDTQNIFELYVRENNSKGGYGIGLSIVHEICIENSILIDVQSSEQSTTFRYIFPKGE